MVTNKNPQRGVSQSMLHGSSPSQVKVEYFRESEKRAQERTRKTSKTRISGGQDGGCIKAVDIIKAFMNPSKKLQDQPSKRQKSVIREASGVQKDLTSLINQFMVAPPTESTAELASTSGTAGMKRLIMST